MGFLSRRLGLLGLTAVAACSPTDVSSNPQGTGGVVAAAGGETTVIPAETGGAVGIGGAPATGGVATGGVAGLDALTAQGESCEHEWQLAVPGHYVRNNVWNTAAEGQTQCILALGDPGRSYAGFELTDCGISVGSSNPASYPSVVKGWHYGLRTTSSGMPRQVSQVGSIPVEWTFTPPSGKYNVSFDIWFHPQQDVSSPDGGLEFMIWVSHGGGPMPAGAQVQPSATVEGATWDINKGTVSTWQYLAYVRNPTSASPFVADIGNIIGNAVGQGHIDPNWYLLGIETGFEIWNCNGGGARSVIRIDVL